MVVLVSILPAGNGTLGKNTQEKNSYDLLPHVGPVET